MRIMLKNTGLIEIAGEKVRNYGLKFAYICKLFYVRGIPGQSQLSLINLTRATFLPTPLPPPTPIALEKLKSWKRIKNWRKTWKGLKDNNMLFLFFSKFFRWKKQAWHIFPLFWKSRTINCWDLTTHHYELGEQFGKLKLTEKIVVSVLRIFVIIVEFNFWNDFLM